MPFKIPVDLGGDENSINRRILNYVVQLDVKLELNLEIKPLFTTCNNEPPHLKITQAMYRRYKQTSNTTLILTRNFKSDCSRVVVYVAYHTGDWRSKPPIGVCIIIFFSIQLRGSYIVSPMLQTVASYVEAPMLDLQAYIGL